MQNVNETILHLKRRWPGPKAIIGELFIDDEIRRQCVTLEDIPREVKVPGRTAIPLGKYQVVLDFSTRFGKILPHLLDVPNFTGVRIHPGNTSADTEGCILVGRYPVNGDFVAESRNAFAELMLILEAANRRGKIFIDVTLDQAMHPIA